MNLNSWHERRSEDALWLKIKTKIQNNKISMEAVFPRKSNLRTCVKYTCTSLALNYIQTLFSPDSILHSLLLFSYIGQLAVDRLLSSWKLYKFNESRNLNFSISNARSPSQFSHILFSSQFAQSLSDFTCTMNLRPRYISNAFFQR